jgi:hypothetical protein
LLYHVTNKNRIMKNIFKIITLLLLTISCKAQFIVNLKDDDGYTRQDFYYYKDINNLLDPFVGTYIYTNGTDTLKIILQKQIMSYDGRCYYDKLIGEYQYIKNGVEISNTLSDINTNHDDLPRSHYIDINGITQFGRGLCKDCIPGEIRVFGSFTDMNEHLGELIIRKLMVGNNPAIEINISWETRYRKPNDPVTPGIKLSGGDYILIKQ